MGKVGKSRDPVVRVSCRLPTLQKEELFRGTAPPLCAHPAVHCWPPPPSAEHPLCSGGACRAGASFALPGLIPSKLGQMQEHKPQVCAWDLTLSLRVTVPAEKQVGSKIRTDTRQTERMDMTSVNSCVPLTGMRCCLPN